MAHRTLHRTRRIRQVHASCFQHCGFRHHLLCCTACVVLLIVGLAAVCCLCVDCAGGLSTMPFKSWLELASLSIVRCSACSGGVQLPGNKHACTVLARVLTRRSLSSRACLRCVQDEKMRLKHSNRFVRCSHRLPFSESHWRSLSLSVLICLFLRALLTRSDSLPVALALSLSLFRSL